ncbi:hypothetical protein QBC38DRAFT_550279 [Podospora fimiseda]|uniref:Uncharacterized protein n=1 Tax=Podospora fimiseda TaxID=252190 RepID=A0AAN7BF25_9PEZI|nr:hypothetical protein QBC38DRAFT_550279 [Podospora fimiseda]
MYHRLGASVITTMDSSTSPDTTSPAVGRSSSVSIDAAINNKPQPTPLRTIIHDEPEPLRRRAYTFDASDVNHRLRRSSTFSGYSLSEVGREFQEDILDPGPIIHHDEDTSWKSSLPLMFAILPATVGLVFKNGSSFVTDVILLGLAAVFLHWSVSAPWKWYHSAQQIREENESVVETAFEDDDEEAETIDSPSKTAPEDEDSQLKLDRAAVAGSALKKLRIHEVLALITCFVAPALATFLLHYIRDYLSRPSEGLVSNFNLTIFLLAAETSPVSHSIKLIQSKTFHLQRIVQSHQNPHKQKEKVTTAQWNELLARLDELENRQQNQQPQNGNSPAGATANEKKAMHAALVREVRNSVQPEIDALNRAVRRYEKKARVLSLQTESRLRELGTRVDDSISLSAMAVSSRRKGIGGMGITTAAQRWGGWCFNGVLWVVLLPFRVVVGALVKAVEAVGWVFGFGSGVTELRKKQKGKVVEKTCANGNVKWECK